MFRSSRAIAFASLIVPVTLAGCATTAPSSPSSLNGSAPLLATNHGAVRGAVDGDVHIFKGIRYAASTEGHRFERSQAPERWTGVRDALDYGNDCPQVESRPVPLFASWVNNRERSEDCLFLNVWTRGLNDGGKRPIMVWLHGGGYVTGSGSSHGYDGTRLVRRGDVVIVTLNHRLNAFGHLYVAGLTDDPKYADSGNVGMLDIVRALEWVRDNAAAIGGDPGNVTIFGESGGAAKVSTLMGMEAARGLFHRAIAQSGSMSLRAFTPAIGTGVARDLATTAGTPAASAERLATMPMADLIALMSRSRTRGAFFQPVMDGRSLTRHPFAPDASPVSRDVPLLVGTNRTEMRLQAGLEPENFALEWGQLPGKIKPFLGDLDPGPIIAGMRQAFPASDASDIFFRVATHRNYRKTAITQAERKSRAGGAPIWMYRLDWETPIDGGKWQSPHALDIAFVFDNVAKSVSMTGTGAAQQRLADLMSDAWIAFARTGDPRTAALPVWPGYDMQRRATMIFDVEPKIVDDPDSAERQLLEILPEGRGQ